MGTTPLKLAIILARANAYLRASAMLRLGGAVVLMNLDGHGPIGYYLVN